MGLGSHFQLSQQPKEPRPLRSTMLTLRAVTASSQPFNPTRRYLLPVPWTTYSVLGLEYVHCLFPLPLTTFPTHFQPPPSVTSLLHLCGACQEQPACSGLDPGPLGLTLISLSPLTSLLSLNWIPLELFPASSSTAWFIFRFGCRLRMQSHHPAEGGGPASLC